MTDDLIAAAVADEAPGVRQALLRVFRAGVPSAGELAAVAGRAIAAGDRPAGRAAVFAWLYGHAFRAAVMRLVEGAYDRVRERIGPLCRSLGVAPDDVMQQTWLKARQRVGQETRVFPRDAGQAVGWLQVSAERMARDMWRANRRYAPLPDASLRAGRAGDPAADAEVREDLERLRTAIAELPGDQAEALVRRFQDEEAPVAIAGDLGVPVETVYYLLKRAKSRLREGLGAAATGGRLS